MEAVTKIEFRKLMNNVMELNKTEINLRRLLASLPQQTNQAKLAHYLVTLREQLASLTGDNGQGLSSISAEKAKEYQEQIEALASKINVDIMVFPHSPDMWENFQDSDAQSNGLQSSTPPMNQVPVIEPEDLAYNSGLRRRHLPSRVEDAVARDSTGNSMVKLDASTHQLIEKHRQLQEDLTDEMVVLAHQMKDTSLMMNRSLMDSEKVLDSTEHAMEYSLATTNQSNLRANEIYTQSFKTGCLTWLIIFAMCCVFLFMVFLIRIT
eukprot:c22954_g1_i6 orf=265-1062(-)